MKDKEGVLFLKPAVGTAIWGNGGILKRYPVEVPAAIDRNQVAGVSIFSGDARFPSVVLNGSFAGRGLNEVYDEHPELFGEAKHPWGMLPIAVGMGHAAEDLSIQVHPQEWYALKHEAEHGKAECWYIVDVDSEPTDVVLGHRAKTLEEFKEYAEAERFDELLLRKPVKKGSFYNLLAGTLHALQKGTTFIEICSASNLTYRLYDYHRKGPDGKERTLQKDKFYDNVIIPYEEMTYDFRKATYGGVTETLLTDNDNFSARLFDVEGKGTVEKQKPYYACFVVEGEGSAQGYALKAGDSFVLTRALPQFTLEGNMKVLAAHG